MLFNTWYQQIHTPTILLCFLVVPHLSFPCSTFALIEEHSQSITLFVTMTNKHSIIECVLACSTKKDCQVSAFDENKKICNLYTSSKDEFVLSGDLFFFKKVLHASSLGFFIKNQQSRRNHCVKPRNFFAIKIMYFIFYIMYKKTNFF